MIYNSFGIDDIHGFAVIKMRKCAPKRLCFRPGEERQSLSTFYYTAVYITSQDIYSAQTCQKIDKLSLVDFFIQAAGLVYHHASACISLPKAYIITQSVNPPAAWWYTRLTPWWYTIPSELMIYMACAVIKMRKCAPKRLCFRPGRRKAKPFDFLLYRCLYYESRYLFRSYLPTCVCKIDITSKSPETTTVSGLFRSPKSGFNFIDIISQKSLLGRIWTTHLYLLRACLAKKLSKFVPFLIYPNVNSLCHTVICATGRARTRTVMFHTRELLQTTNVACQQLREQ